jgi:hypothetical protein
MKRFGPSIFMMGFARVAFRDIGKFQGVSRTPYATLISHYHRLSGQKLCMDTKQHEAIYAVHPLLLLLSNLHITKPPISRLATISTPSQFLLSSPFCFDEKDGSACQPPTCGPLSTRQIRQQFPPQFLRYINTIQCREIEGIPRGINSGGILLRVRSRCEIV